MAWWVATGLGGYQGGGGEDGDRARRKERQQRGMWRRRRWRMVSGSRKRQRTVLGSDGDGPDLKWSGVDQKWSGALVFKWSKNIRDTAHSKRRHG